MTTVAAASGLRRLQDLPSPRGLPLLGNALALKPERLHRTLEDWRTALGDVYTFGLGPTRVLVSADPEHLQAALRDRPERFRRFSTIEPVIAEMRSNGVFSVEGEAWRPQRRLVMQALSPSNVRGFFPTLRQITARLRARWLRAARAGATVDMKRDVVLYATDVIAALAFGEDPNTIDDSGDAIQAHLAKIMPTINARINAPVPYWRYVRLPRDRDFDRSTRIVTAHIDGLIDRARRRMADDPAPTPRNVLEALIAAAADEGSGIDDRMIAANVMTLLVAGQDTTATTLAWTSLFLCADPGLQDRLHAMAADALDDSGVCASHDDLKALDAFEHLTAETARFKPTVPVFFLETITDVALGGVSVPAGTPVFFLLRPAMLDERRFGCPGSYLPQRWDTGHSTVQPHDTRAFAQFGAGPRVCPGRYLAGIEARLVLSMLMREFSISLVDDPASIREVMAFAMMPSRMRVRLTPRR